MPSLFSYEEHVWVGGGKPEIEDMDYFVEKSEVCFAFARTAKFNGTPLLLLARKLRPRPTGICKKAARVNRVKRCRGFRSVRSEDLTSLVAWIK